MFGQDASTSSDTIPASAVQTSAPLPPNQVPYSPTQVSVFNNQLQQYQVQLQNMYDQRSTMIADRESDRFAYLSGFLFSLNAVAAGITADAQSANLSAADLAALGSFFSSLYALIPMSDVYGSAQGTFNQNLPTWPIPAAASGATSSVINALMPADTILNWPNFLSDQAYIENTNIVDTPVTSSMLPALLTGFSASGLSTVTGLIAKAYQWGSLNSIIDSGNTSLQTLLSDTEALANYQYNILSFEQQIQTFLTQYQQFGMVDAQLSVSDIMNQITNLSNSINAQNILQLQLQAVAASSTLSSPLTSMAPAAAAVLPASTQAILSEIPQWAYYAGGAILFYALFLKRGRQ